MDSLYKETTKKAAWRHEIIALAAACLAKGRDCLYSGDASKCMWEDCTKSGECSCRASPNDYKIAAKLLGIKE